MAAWTPPSEGDRTVVYGATSAGRFLAVLVVQDEDEDDGWGHRRCPGHMTEPEISELRRLRGGGHE